MDYSNFGGAPTDQGGPTGEVIPDGTLAWAIVTVRPHNLDQGHVLTPSKNTEGNAYLDIELTILEGPYARRKIWDIIMLKAVGEKADKTIGMGMASAPSADGTTPPPPIVHGGVDSSMGGLY